MNSKIFSPFYTIDDNILKYLDKVEICSLPSEEKIKETILKDNGFLLNNFSYKKCENSVLILEPHADDFALSALGYTIDKYNSIVLNVFSKTTLKYFPWLEKINYNSEEYENLRLKESEFVINKILSQKFISMKEKSLRITKESISNIEKRIISNIDKILKNNKSIKKILVPLGVGNHPDHLIIFDIIMNNIDKYKNYEIILYPEYPYSRCRNIYQDRIIKIKNKYKLTEKIIDVKEYLDIIVDCISSYKSQFDDINRNQMYAIFKEDTWGIAQDFNKYEFALIYFKLEVK